MKFLPILVLAIIIGGVVGFLMYRDNCLDAGNDFSVGTFYPQCKG